MSGKVWVMPCRSQVKMGKANKRGNRRWLSVAKCLRLMDIDEYEVFAVILMVFEMQVGRKVMERKKQKKKRRTRPYSR